MRVASALPMTRRSSRGPPDIMLYSALYSNTVGEDSGQQAGLQLGLRKTAAAGIRCSEGDNVYRSTETLNRLHPYPRLRAE